jgi:hypothetical protein
VTLSAPRFGVHVFTEPVKLRDLLLGYPSVRTALFIDGVPDGFIGRRYTVDSEVAAINLDERGVVLRFGSTGISGIIGIEIETGRVVECPAGPRFNMCLVNASVGQFTRTVKELIERFPYYDQEASDEEIETVAYELRDIIGNIDPGATAPENYWSTFIEDVLNGDMSNEDVVAEIRRNPGGLRRASGNLIAQRRRSRLGKSGRDQVDAWGESIVARRRGISLNSGRLSAEVESMTATFC